MVFTEKEKKIEQTVFFPGIKHGRNSRRIHTEVIIVIS